MFMKPSSPIVAAALEVTLKACLSQARAKLDLAIARDADVCAEAGFCQKTLEITLDIDQFFYDGTTLSNAVSLLNRLSKTD